MRRVHVINGLKQRMNELLGTDTSEYDPQGSPADTIHAITPWSIQAAMLEGMRRIVAGLVGDSGWGRPIRGLSLQKSGNNIIVSPGYGITTNGEIIWSRFDLTIPISTVAGIHYYYLLYKTKKLNGSDESTPEARRTSVIGDVGLYDIVYDDMAAYWEDAEAYALFTESVGAAMADDGVSVFLGTYNTAGSILTPNGLRGLPNYANDAIDATSAILETLTVTGSATIQDLEISGRVNLNSGSSLYPDGSTVGVTNNISVRNATGDGVTVLNFIKGILVGTS
jgi:hypothetical protein